MGARKNYSLERNYRQQGQIVHRTEVIDKSDKKNNHTNDGQKVCNSSLKQLFNP